MESDKQEALGEQVEDFELADLEGEYHRLSQYRGALVVITFWSAECPVSAEYDPFFNQLWDRYAPAPLVVLGIDSNVHYDNEEIIKAATEREIRFPILRDADCAIGDRFGALTTPHVFILDKSGRLAYAGAVDDRTFRQPEATINYVDQALEALMAGKKLPITQTQPYGCTIVRHK